MDEFDYVKRVFDESMEACNVPLNGDDQRPRCLPSCFIHNKTALVAFEKQYREKALKAFLPEKYHNALMKSGTMPLFYQKFKGSIDREYGNKDDAKS